MSSAAAASSSSSTTKKPKAEVKSDKAEFPVIHNETLDLEAYIAGYVGYTKVRRLVFIAERCPELRLRAYRLAIEELKRGQNTQLYVDVISKAREALGDRLGDEWGLDNEWKKNADRKATETLTRLEIELNNQKRDQERDPTRRAYEQLGNFHSERGDWNNALTMYTTMKDYCANNRNTLDMCRAVIKASIHSGTMSYVNTHAGRVKNLPETEPGTRSSANAALGLYSLKAGNYRGAAEMFLEVGTDIEGVYNDIITIRDVAIYGAMAALASFSRQELKLRVLGNPEFKKVLEKAPGWRQIVTNFYESNYSLCFDAIIRLKPDLLLDFYLGAHVEKLINRMRDRAMVQYFRPFVTVKLPMMAAAFKMEVPALEESLARLIADNQIAARIDSANKILYARHADQRNATYVQALSVGNKYIRDCKALLMRMSLVEHNFVVRPADRRKGGRGDEDDEEGKGGKGPQ